MDAGFPFCSFVLSLSKDEPYRSRIDRVNPGLGTQRERFIGFNPDIFP